MKLVLAAMHKTTELTSARDMFRLKFQRSLRECLRHGFAVEESFGMVWEETLDEICLLEEEKSTLYEELIAWARLLPAKNYSPVIHRICSHPNRTGSSKSLMAAP